MAVVDLNNILDHVGPPPITPITRIGPHGLSSVRAGYSLNGIAERGFYAQSAPERAEAMTELTFLLLFRTTAPYTLRPMATDLVKQLDRERAGVPPEVRARCPGCAGSAMRPCYVCPSIPYLMRVYASIAPRTPAGMQKLLTMVYVEFDRQMKARSVASAVPLGQSMLAAIGALCKADQSCGVSFNFPGDYNGPDLVTIPTETLNDPELTEAGFHVARAKVVDDQRRKLFREELLRPPTQAEQQQFMKHAAETVARKKRKCVSHHGSDEDEEPGDLAPLGDGSPAKPKKPQPAAAAAAIATPVEPIAIHLENCLRDAPNNSAFRISMDQAQSRVVVKARAEFQKLVTEKRAEEATQFARTPKLLPAAEIRKLQASRDAKEAHDAIPGLAITEEKLKAIMTRARTLTTSAFHIRLLLGRLVLAHDKLCAEVSRREKQNHKDGGAKWLNLTETQLRQMSDIGRLVTQAPNVVYLDPHHYTIEWLRVARPTLVRALTQFKADDPGGYRKVWEVTPTDQSPPAAAKRAAAAAAMATEDVVVVS